MKKLVKCLAVTALIGVAIGGIAYLARKKSQEDTFDDDFDDDFLSDQEDEDVDNTADRSYVSINLEGTENEKGKEEVPFKAETSKSDE